MEISEDGNAEKQINLAFDFLEGEPDTYDRCLFWGVTRHNEEEQDRPGDNSDDEVGITMVTKYLHSNHINSSDSERQSR